MSNNEKAPVLSREEKAIAKANAKMEKKLAKKRTKIRESFGDSVLLAFTTIILLAVLIIVGYPVLYVISSSFSSNKALNAGRVILFPVDPSLASYKFVFQYTVVWNGFKMTVFYTVVGVIITMLPLLIVGLIARLKGKVNYYTMMGLMAGSMTDPPALGFANASSGNDMPALGYATVYPVVMFLRVLSAQLLMLMAL